MDRAGSERLVWQAEIHRLWRFREMQAVVPQQTSPTVGSRRELVSEARLKRRLDAFQIGDRPQTGIAADDHRERVVESEVRAPMETALCVGARDGCVDRRTRLLQRLMQGRGQRRAG